MASRTDPICGMIGTIEHQGRWFCSRHCISVFERGAGPHTAAAEARAPAGHRYTCPMHPDIIADRPGACPKCGMALEPREPALEQGPDLELIDMTRRLWISAGLTLPIVCIAMAEMLGSIHPGTVHHGLGRGIQLILCTPIVMWAGWPFFVRGWRSVRHRSLNMFTLIATGIGAAFGYSVVATVAPGAFPEAFRMAQEHVGVYFEAAAIITTLVLLGQVLELRARARTGAAIRSLMQLAPTQARRLRNDGTEEEIPAAHIAVGDRLRVRPGERVPADGVVIEGAGAVDESMMTGESMPVEKTPGAHVTGGTVNGTGSLVMEARRVGSQTLLAQIVRLVAEAQRSRAPIQRVADTVSAYFVPGVMIGATITFAVWATVGPEPRIAYALANAVAVLIIACPCALGLATPMSIMVGVGRGARAGILFRHAEALETMERVDTLIVDKTGTLTEGKPAVTAIVPAAGLADTEVLRLAASLEQGSEHPLAHALVSGARQRSVRLVPATAFRSLTGRGVVGEVEGRRVGVGNAALLDELGIPTSAVMDQADRLRAQGQTVIVVVLEQAVAGLIGIADPIKTTTPEAIQLLHREQVRLIMASGDHQATAQVVGQMLGIDEVQAGILPEQKTQLVQQLKSSGAVVAMAGDGVNDAPALAAADVGIAMGTGTDAAMESAGVTLVKGDLRAIAAARRLSRATMRNIRQNLFFAFVYNVLGIPIAAGVLYPLLGWLLSPAIAGAAMSFSSVSVIANALRLRRATL